MTSSLPVWVGDRQRWVTGIGRKTTCEEVIAVLLHGEGCATEGQYYTIMERWRRMERPLDPRAKILKVWRAWGDTQNEVKLTLRRIDGEADSGRGSPSHSSSHRRRRNRNKPSLSSQETIHPRRLAQLRDATDGRKIPESIEQLMKLILAQGETIQSQLKRLQDREHQIEHFEDEKHRARVETLGSNYLLETYLGGGKLAVEVEEDKENDSGVLTGGSDQTSPVSLGERHKLDDRDADANFTDDVDDATTKDSNQRTIDEGSIKDLQARVEVWEKLAKVNRRLEREEENLVRIHKKIQRYHKKLESKGDLRLLPEERLDDESVRVRGELLRDLEQVRVDLERGTRELEHNSLALAESEALLDARHHYLRRLQAEVEATDRETLRLQQMMSATLAQAQQAVAAGNGVVPVPTKGILKKTGNTITTVAVIHNDTDSNSDTGLSSLHSSSEEGVYTLDTLV